MNNRIIYGTIKNSAGYSVDIEYDLFFTNGVIVRDKKSKNKEYIIHTNDKDILGNDGLLDVNPSLVMKIKRLNINNELIMIRLKRLELESGLNNYDLILHEEDFVFNIKVTNLNGDHTYYVENMISDHEDNRVNKIVYTLYLISDDVTDVSKGKKILFRKTMDNYEANNVDFRTFFFKIKENGKYLLEVEAITKDYDTKTIEQELIVNDIVPDGVSFPIMFDWE